MSHKFFTRTLIGAGCLGALAGSAMAQSISATAPVIDGAAGGATNIEFIGIAEDTDQRIVLTFTATTSIADNNANAILRLQFQKSDGSITGGTLDVGPDDGAAGTGLFRQVTGDGDANIEAGEVWSFDISQHIAAIPSDAALMQVTWAPAGDNVSLASNADGLLTGTANDATDERYELVRTRTVFSSAFVSGSGATTDMNLTFTFPTVGRGTNAVPIAISGLPASNPNGTAAGGGAATDFTFVDTSNVATQQFNSGVAPAGTADINAGSFTIVGSGQALHFTFDSANSTLDTAGARFSTTATTTVRDAAGNRVVGQNFQSAVAGNRGFVLSSAQPVPSFTSARFVTATRIEVTFSTPVDKTALPSADFFDLNLTDGTTTNLTNVGVTINAGLTAAAANNVIVFDTNANLSPGAGDNISVRANGTAFDDNGGAGTYAATGKTFTLVADENTGTTDFTDIFGKTLGDTSTVAQSNVVADGIVPTLMATAILDQNHDGDIDGIALAYDEPVADTTATAGLTAKAVDGATVRPFRQIDPATGALVEDTIDVTAPNDVLTATVARGSFDFDFNPNSDNQDLEVNNAIILTIQPTTFTWKTGAADDASDAIPGTGDVNTMTVEFDSDAVGAAIADVAGNGADTFGATLVDDDGAAPIPAFAFFFTGDNQNNGSNNQLFTEVDGTAGDQEGNDRILFAMSEDALNIGDLDRNQISYRNGTRRIGGGGGFDFITDNMVTIRDNSFAGSDGFESSDSFSFLANNFLVDDFGNSAVNPLAGPIAAVNHTSPYVPLDVDINGATVASAYLVDTTPVADGIADQISLRFAAPVDPTTFQQADFTVSPGVITGATLASNGVDATITLDVSAANQVRMTDTVTLTYRGSTDATPIGRLGSPLTAAVSQLNANITVNANAQPSQVTQNVAIQTFRGSVLGLDGNPVPIGSKMFVLIGVPRVKSITATHNNIPFRISDFDDSSSMEAMTNFILGLQPFVYLHRDLDNDTDGAEATGNFQYYSNCKGQSDSAATRDSAIISMTVGTNLNNLTFTGTGETTATRVSGGSVRMVWDVLRSDGGTMTDLYPDSSCDSSGGYQYFGCPILSSAVIDNTTGTYEIHVSAPISAFDGVSRLNAIERPLIFILSTPDDQRFPLSGLVSSSVRGQSASGLPDGDPILFRPNNRTRQSTAPNAGPNTTIVNFDLRNVGEHNLFGGWNMVPMDRNGGVATSTGNQPSPLPVGITGGSTSTDSFAAVPNLSPTAGPLDQFVFFYDDNGDGKWTSADDDDCFFDGIVLDNDAWDHFAFTMSNQGPKLGNDVNALSGGMAFGFFNNDNASEIGMFQFGPEMNSASVFPASGTFFPNNTTTFGWALGTITTNPVSPATNPFATPAAFFTANPRADYIIIFQNDGGIIRVFSQDASSDANEINNVGAIPDGTPAFIHFTN